MDADEGGWIGDVKGMGPAEGRKEEGRTKDETAGDASDGERSSHDSSGGRQWPLSRRLNNSCVGDDDLLTRKGYY